MTDAPDSNRLETTATDSDLSRIYGMPGHLIRRAHQLSVAAFAESTREYGLTPVQYGTLTIADIYPGIDQVSLAGMVAFDRSTIGDVIQRLEQRGFLRREEGVDRRTKLVFITPEGREMLCAMRDPVMRAQEKMLEPLSDGERAILVFLLSKLVSLGGDVGRSPARAAARIEPLPTPVPTPTATVEKLERRAQPKRGASAPRRKRGADR